MRLTSKLNAQHLGWTFKKHWQVQGKRTPHDLGASDELQKLNLVVSDPKEVVTEKRIMKRDERFNNSAIGNPLNWNSRECHVYTNRNILLEGVSQAQLLTKTVAINCLPKYIEDAISLIEIPSTANRCVQQSIMSSYAFDAEQIKKSKIKLADRPAYNLPRLYDISDNRKNRLLINKLVIDCEKLGGRSITSRRRLFDSASFKVTLPKDNKLLQFDVSVEKILMAMKPLESVRGKYDDELPNLWPINYTITIPKTNIYTIESNYPLNNFASAQHPHTIFLHFNKEVVANTHNSSVTTSQFQSHNMIKAFTVAASRAKQLYGDTQFKSLPKPILVQSIQTDGRTFHFGVFQLNTLELDGTDGLKNYWFHHSNMDLFAECGYKSGKPILEGYNKDVFRYFNAFYNAV